MGRYGRHLLFAVLALTVVLVLPVYLVLSSVPAPQTRAAIGLAQAKRVALGAAGGGEVLVAATTVRAGQAVYDFFIRSVGRAERASASPSGAAVIAHVLVAPATGRVLSLTYRAASRAAGPRGAVTADRGRSAPLPVGKVRAEARQAVGGGQVLDVTRTEPNDRGVWAYRVRILLATSEQVDVMVGEHGGVLGVRTGSGG